MTNNATTKIKGFLAGLKLPILVSFLVTASLFISIAIPLLVVSQYPVDFKKEVNPTIANGIMTSSAIVFGFVTLELRHYVEPKRDRFLLAFPLLVFLMLPVFSYISDAVNLGYLTVYTLITAGANFFFNIVYMGLILLLDFLFERYGRSLS